MKRLYVSALTTVVAAFAMLAAAGANASANSAMVDMWVENMKNEGAFKHLSSCSGKPVGQLEKAFRKDASHCVDKFGVGNPQAMSECIQQQSMKSTGLTQAEMQTCEESHQAYQESDDALSPIEQEMDALHDQIGDREPTSAELAKLKALQAKMMSNSRANIDQYLEAGKQQSKQTAHLISLPRYPDSQVMMHMHRPSEMSVEDETFHTLPAATLASAASFAKVVAFYQKKLPNFEMKKISDDNVVFMEKMPKNFDVLTHMKEFATTPHVAISSYRGASAAVPNGTQTSIEIAYRP